MSSSFCGLGSWEIDALAGRSKQVWIRWALVSLMRSLCLGCSTGGFAIRGHGMMEFRCLPSSRTWRAWQWVPRCHGSLARDGRDHPQS